VRALKLADPMRTRREQFRARLASRVNTRGRSEQSVKCSRASLGRFRLSVAEAGYASSRLPGVHTCSRMASVAVPRSCSGPPAHPTRAPEKERNLPVGVGGSNPLARSKFLRGLDDNLLHRVNHRKRGGSTIAEFEELSGC